MFAFEVLSAGRSILKTSYQPIVTLVCRKVLSLLWTIGEHFSICAFRIRFPPSFSSPLSYRNMTVIYNVFQIQPTHHQRLRPPPPSLPGSTVCMSDCRRLAFRRISAKDHSRTFDAASLPPYPRLRPSLPLLTSYSGGGEGSIRETAVAMATEVRTPETGEGVGCGEGRSPDRAGARAVVSSS